MQWRVRKAGLPAGLQLRCLGLAYGAAFLVFRGLGHLMLGPRLIPSRGVSAWIMAVAACAVVQWVVSRVLIMSAIKASEPSVRVREIVAGGEPLGNDITELCVAILASLAIAMSVVTVVIALPLVTMLQCRSGTCSC